MAHRTNQRDDASAWAGQPGARDGIQPFNLYYHPAIVDDFYLPDTDVPRNPQLSIQAFNADLPSLPDPKNQGPDLDAQLSIELLIGGGSSFENKDLGHGAAGPSSHGLARSISQASSHGKDDIESVTFSQSDFAESFGNFNPLNSATTSVSEYIVPSIESSPGVVQRPFLNVQTNNASPSLNTLGFSASSSPTSAHGFPTNTFNFQTTPTSAPRQSVSALSAGLSSHSHLPSPASPFYEDWSAQFSEDGNAGLSQSWGATLPSGDFPLFTDGQSQPSLVIHPPETTNMFEQFEDFNIPGPSPASGIHPIDHTSTNSFTFQNTRTQNFRDMRPSVPFNPTDDRLEVPRQRPRRSSDYTRPGNPLSSQARRVHRPVDPRTNRPRSHTALPPPNRSSMIQLPRASQEHIIASSTTTAPVQIRSRSKKPEAAAAPFPSTSPKGPARGRRNGPMEAKSREQAKDTRNKKTVCIRCKYSKQGCRRVDNSPDSPCVQCEKHGCSSKWPGPCELAHFEDLVLSRSCNYVSQRAINHLSLDGTRRIRIPLQRVFPLDDVIAALDNPCDFDIRVHQDNRPVYTLNLQKCHEYLLTLKAQIGGGRTDRSPSAFIDRDLVQLDADWEACMDNVVTDDPLALLCAIHNMPSRARYSYVYKAHVHLPERFLDPESPSDSGPLHLAAQLARVICRKVEVKAYTYLQRALYKSTEPKVKEEELLPLLRRVGCILASLRWRLAWWTVMPGNPPEARDEDGARAECQKRVYNLCRRLYFHYCSARRRLATWSTVDSLRGVWSLYPDTDRKVLDAFPGDETSDAFEEWLAKGQGLIYEAGASRVLRPIVLPTSVCF
ncbi:hypothetical protein CGCSCA4_v008013 [Colletotrichum siamense]|uniref:Uncharacterized protein n=1 Tax=Colletotrichum siamense TaxID=690259 RepID=A0A9P5ETA5_COLSI|nr:hypothetical protein CGCSCA4_v008013 [Colletotrichum siamense]KAF4859140.1 hypothetical protein CGCSCA2_v006517 [Colletotrichum siamense]